MLNVMDSCKKKSLDPDFTEIPQELKVYDPNASDFNKKNRGKRDCNIYNWMRNTSWPYHSQQDMQQSSSTNSSETPNANYTQTTQHAKGSCSIKNKTAQTAKKTRTWPCVSDPMQTEQGIAAASDFNKTNRGKRKLSLHLSLLEDLKPRFGKKLKDVAEELGVGRSTIKRACREFGIDRWPGNEKQARNQSLFERETTPNPPSRTITEESTQHNVIDLEEAEKVMVRVKYDGDTIKFELCLSLGVNMLFEEVARRLNLEIGSFKLKYVDEDNEKILIACDDDLQLCAKSQIASGKTCIQLFIPK